MAVLLSTAAPPLNSSDAYSEFPGELMRMTPPGGPAMLAGALVAAMALPSAVGAQQRDPYPATLQFGTGLINIPTAWVSPDNSARRRYWASGSGNLAFEGGPGTTRVVTDAYPAIGEADVSDSLTTLLVTIEESATATTPSSVQPFWSTVIKTAGGSTGGTLPFGEFTFGDDSRGPVRFVAQGKLAGG